MKRRTLRQQRPEAFWGALIGAGASILGSLIGGKSQADSARAQADAIIQASKENARALEEQNKNNNLLQQQSQKFIADQNAEARQFQRDLQTSMQLQAGQLSTDERRTANRIVVKKGGKITSRKKLRDIPFYGGANLPYRVLDGGFVLPLFQTPEGYDVGEIIGNDHDHYHKGRNGKPQSGVGIEFAINGGTRKSFAKGGRATKIVEGEGNQNTNIGELLVRTPSEALFISKHNMPNGFNPAKAVLEDGMHPIDAYNLQEASKTTSPVRGNRHKATAGILVNDVLPLNYPIYDVNNMTRRQLRKGGRCKAVYGYGIGSYYDPNANYYMLPGGRYGVTTPNGTIVGDSTGLPEYSTAPYINGSSNSSDNGSRTRWYNNLSGNMIGAGITGLGNILGAGISNYFISRGAKIGAAGALEAARIQGNALRNLQTVDMSMLEGDSGKLMFSRGHYMPVTESTRAYGNNQIEQTRRDQRQQQDLSARSSLSSAARLARMAGINSTAGNTLSKIADALANQEAENKRANMAAINEAGGRNLQLDIEALRDRTAARLDLLKYNNDIVNRRIAEPAQLEGEAIANAAGIRANAKNAIGQGWASAIAGTGQAFGNAFAMDAKQRNDLQMARMSATHSGNLAYLKYAGTPSELNAEITRLQNIYNDPSSNALLKESAARDLRYLGINV